MLNDGICVSASLSLLINQTFQFWMNDVSYIQSGRTAHILYVLKSSVWPLTIMSYSALLHTHIFGLEWILLPAKNVYNFRQISLYLVFTSLVNGKFHPLTVIPHGVHLGWGGIPQSNSTVKLHNETTLRAMYVKSSVYMHWRIQVQHPTHAGSTG